MAIERDGRGIVGAYEVAWCLKEKIVNKMPWFREIDLFGKEMHLEKLLFIVESPEGARGNNEQILEKEKERMSNQVPERAPFQT